MIAGFWLMALAWGPQDTGQEVRDLVQQGEWLAALEACEELPDRAQGADLKAWVLWSGGDLGGALKEARKGLEQNPAPSVERSLLSNASQLSLALGLAAPAVQWTERLEASVRSAPDLSETERQNWLEGWGPGTGVASYMEQALALQEKDEDSSNTLLRAQWTTGVIGLGALLAMLWILLRQSRGAEDSRLPQTRPGAKRSDPVEL